MASGGQLKSCRLRSRALPSVKHGPERSWVLEP